MVQVNPNHLPTCLSKRTDARCRCRTLDRQLFSDSGEAKHQRRVSDCYTACL